MTGGIAKRLPRQLSPSGAVLLLLFISAVWGSGFVVSQVCYDEGITPIQLIAGRFVTASLMLDILFIKIIRGLDRKTVAAGCIIGFLLLFGFVFQNYGLMYSTPSICAFVTSVYVVMIPLFGWVMFKKRPETRALAASVMAMIGVVIFSVSGDGPGGFAVSMGAVLTLAAAAFYAFQVIATERFTRVCSPLALAIVTINVTALLSLIVILGGIITTGDMPAFTAKGVSALVYLGMFCTALCFLGQNIGQKYTSASKAGIVLSTEAIFGALMSALIMGERLTARMLVGAVIIFAAVIVSEASGFMRNS